MNSSLKKPVIIAGAGPVGLLTALVLARQEVPVIVVEAEAALTRDLRAGTFHPPTQEIMQPLGITAKMLEIGIKVPRWQWRDRKEGLIVEWDLSLLKDDTPYPWRLHLEQHRLTPIIFELLQPMAHVQVRFSTRFEGVEQQGDGVRVRVTGPDGALTLDGAWLIGADGGRSQVRKSVDIEFEGFTWPERYVVISTTNDLARYGYASNAYIADPEEWIAVFHMPDAGPPGLWRMCCPVNSDLSEDEVLSDAYAQRMLRRFLPVAESMHVPYKSMYKVHQRVAKSFRRGRVLLAGDSAHVNNPLGGFGLNSGIHDAINLGAKLAEVMRGEADATLMDRYERQRRAVNIEYVQNVSIANKKALEEKDPARKQERADMLRATAADPIRAREYLLNSSMINSMRMANAIG
ncbi:MAG: FAD-dependent monooxygenase [Burkholderiales bacterium]|nr:FAD-dependent monooxygenase [Burkholderiales bacterium]